MTMLHHLGFDAHFEALFLPHGAAGHHPARVVAEHQGCWRVAGAFGDRLAVATGRLRHAASGRGDLPAVGDWVAVAVPPDGEAVIHAVLPRRGRFSRRAVGGEALEQIVAANVDRALIVVALDGGWSLRRLERYVALAWDSGARPVVVLSKADLCDDVAGRLREAARVAPGVDVVAVSQQGEPGLGPLQAFLRPGETVALVGSSGAGKSTLTNHLLGEARQAVQAVRSGDARGRHTTTGRELFVAPSGVLVIDTPGMRVLGAWEAGDGLSRTFEDVEALVAGCRFSDCTHRREPGCAVQAAVAAGALDVARLASWEKLRREEAHQLRRVDVRAALVEKSRWRQRSRQARERGRP